MALVQLNETGLISSRRVGRFRTFFGGHGYQNPLPDNLGRELFQGLRASGSFEGVHRVFVYAPSKDEDLRRHLNMLTLQLIATENGFDIEFHSPPDPLPAWQDWNRLGEGHYDHFLVGPVDNEETLKSVLRDRHPFETLTLPYQTKMLKFLWVSAETVQDLNETKK